MPFGLNYAYQLQVSPDGRNAYSVAAAGDLIEYSRDPASGALSVIGCISSLPSADPPCASKNATMNVTAVDEPAALAVSPEGNSVYVVSQGGDANDLATSAATPETGLLSKSRMHRPRSVRDGMRNPGREGPLHALWGHGQPGRKERVRGELLR